LITRNGRSPESGWTAGEDAYAFAKGNTVTSNTGQAVRLRRPLDFLVIADHAEYLGVSALLDKQPDLLKGSDIGQRWLKFLHEENRQQILMDSHQISMGRRNPPLPLT
jgi:Protein of unknown function (DUF3604)